jgi:peptide/nickel transport system permease protein
MRRYIATRIIQMIPVFFIISVVIFLLVRILPIDPIYSMIGEDSQALTPEMRELMIKDLGLDKPLPVQYVNWITGILTGDWGTSFQNRRPVVTELASRLPHTLQLAAAAFIISLILGVTGGIVAALKRNTILDAFATTGSMFGIAIPDFWFALMLIIIFSVYLGVLPVFGSTLVWEDPVDGIKHLILPAAALGLNGAATIMRQTRSALLEVLGEDYIRTARAKGLAGRTVIWLHALRNSLLPVVTILGLRLGNILGGAVVIETMFSWPGVGRLAVFALQRSDYPVIQAIVMMSAAAVLLANLLTDLAYAYLDPRIRYS